MSAAGDLPQRSLSGFSARVRLSALAEGTSLGLNRGSLRGKSVFLAVRDQLKAALALIELDGFARRLVLVPPDTPTKYLASLARAADADAVVVDDESEFLLGELQISPRAIFKSTPDLSPLSPPPAEHDRTEWILLTSGTTGAPKLVLHTLSSLVGAVRATANAGVQGRAVWATFYDIRRFGGLQIFLRAVIGGGSLVVSSSEEMTRDFLIRAGEAGVTHITGTPSHWRRALMSGAADRISPRYARLSGEVADQAVLDALKDAYPQAKVAHAFASTEAGVAFEVDDGLAGFPARLIGCVNGGIDMKVEEGTLRIRSSRVAIRYLGQAERLIGDATGFVDTGDMVELRGDRYYFVGRKDGVINVGGQKIHPEEVEAAINAHPNVRMSLVKAKRNPITGALVVAEVVLKNQQHAKSEDQLKSEIIEACRRTLAAHKVPAMIRFVPALLMSEAGKLIRSNA